MILKYDDGDTVRTFQFHPGKLTSPEAEAVEEVGGESWSTFDGWGSKFLNGSRKAYRAALWVMLKRENPTLKFRDVIVTADAITWDYDADEQDQIRKAIIDADPAEIDPEQREQLLKTLAEFPAGKESGTPSENSGESSVSESAQS
jgi:hypothetical protein